jgi:hypothetical protein
LRPPDLGLAGVRRYLGEQFPAEENIECWSGQPIVAGQRAAAEWWASWTEQGQELTYAGVTVPGNIVGYVSGLLARRGAVRRLGLTGPASGSLGEGGLSARTMP